MGERIGVIGAGAWGTTLAKLLTENGHRVTLWAYEPEVAAAIRRDRENPLFLPGVQLPPTLAATHELTEAVRGMQTIVLVCPSPAIRTVTTRFAPALAPDAIVVNCAKGIEVETGKLISHILAETLPQHPPSRFAYLSGPSFAREVAAGGPTAVVIAAADPKVAAAVQRLFRAPHFLAFCHDDVIGVEVGGAMKNVLAIAAGIVDGLGLGHNTRAALITRGLYEIMKLGRALGANPLTFVGLAGLGDLILTCTGALSRNRAVGVALGEGRTLAAITGSARTVAEGVATTKAIHQLIARHRVHAPICTAVYQILYEGKPPRQAVAELTALELHEELGALLHPQGS